MMWLISYRYRVDHIMSISSFYAILYRAYTVWHEFTIGLTSIMYILSRSHKKRLNFDFAIRFINADKIQPEYFKTK